MNSLREVRGLLADNVTSCFALLAVLVLAGGSPARADDAPLMAVKIFNDDPVHWIYPVLTTGKGDQDIWLQGFLQGGKIIGSISARRVLESRPDRVIAASNLMEKGVPSELQKTQQKWAFLSID